MAPCPITSALDHAVNPALLIDKQCSLTLRSDDILGLMATATDFLSTYLDPIAEDLTPQQAEKILAARPNARLIARVEELGNKANEGTLTAEERAEYEYYIDVDEAISLLKTKARRLLAHPAN